MRLLFGEFREIGVVQPGTAAHLSLAFEAGKPFLYIGRILGFALLAVVDYVNAGAGLLLDHAPLRPEALLHLEQLVDVAGEGLDRIYSHCEGYPAPSSRTRQSRLAYLRQHKRSYGAFHNGTVGLSVQRIRMEARLRDEIEDFIDREGISRDWSSQNLKRIRKDIIRQIGQTDLRWALSPPDGPPLSYRLFRGTGWRSILALLVALPFIIVLFPEPLEPTKAVVEPAGARKQTFFKTGVPRQ